MLPRRRILLPVLACLTLSAVLASYFVRQSPPSPPATAINSVNPTPSPTTLSQTTPEPDLVLDLFDPSPQSLATQQNAAAISGQIEKALSVTFLLTSCELLSKQEYRRLYNAMITYAERTGLAPDAASAATRVRTIASAAGASYSLLYSRIPCADPSLPPLADTLITWRKSMNRAVQAP